MQPANITTRFDDLVGRILRPLRPLTTALALCLLACPALAQPVSTAQAQLALGLTAVRVVVERTDDGTGERLEPAISAAPGDVIEWRLEARNESKIVARGVSLELPVPANAVYIDASASATWAIPESDPRPLDPTVLDFSFDGGVSFGALPLTREVVTTVDGETVTTLEIVPPADYTHVRLVLESFEPDHTYFLTLRAEVR